MRSSSRPPCDVDRESTTIDTGASSRAPFGSSLPPGGRDSPSTRAIFSTVERWSAALARPEAVSVLFLGDNVELFLKPAAGETPDFEFEFNASGAVLPGVTVEATSPALIEKVRTAVTDGTGKATKEQVQFMVQRTLRLRTPPSPADAADGVAVALCHCSVGVTTARITAVLP